MAGTDRQRYRYLWLWHLLLATLFLAACRGAEPPPTATLVAVAPSPTRIEATATPTPEPTPTTAPPSPTAPAATVTPSPSATAFATSTPPTTATAAPTASATPSPPSTFREVGQLAAGEIQALWPAPDGSVWVVTVEGLYAVTPGQVRNLSTRQPVAVLGEDREGRVWVLFDQGEAVAAFQAGTWTFYGPEQGWEPASAANFGRGDAAVVDQGGRVWLALGRAGLRLFDPGAGAWQTLRAPAVGYAPPPAGDDGLFRYDERLAFTRVALDSFGNVWTGACAVRVLEDGFLLGEGQGARWFDGEGWAGPGESGARCVQDIEVDANGEVWLAGQANDLWQDNLFLRYQPDPGRWLRQPVPESQEEFAENPRFVREFWFDTAGRPWMEVERRGGATIPPAAVYYREGEAWIPFLPLLLGTLAGRPETGFWIYLDERAAESEQGLYRQQGDGFAPVVFPAELLDPATMTVDSGGRAWFTGRDGASLWYYAER